MLLKSDVWVESALQGGSWNSLSSLFYVVQGVLVTICLVEYTKADIDMHCHNYLVNKLLYTA